jgi:hypothetical protein
MNIDAYVDFRTRFHQYGYIVGEVTFMAGAMGIPFRKRNEEKPGEREG